MSLDWYHYSHGYHINNEMWVYTSSDKQQFIEMGLRNGLAIGGDPCGDGICVAYELFWADWNGDGHEYSHFLANATPDGSAHSYEMISRPASSIWDLYYDGNYRGTSTIELSGTANEVEVGLELASTYNGDIGAWAHADTFDNYNLETRDTGGSWSFFPYINTWRDYPCGNVYSPPFCLNGNAPSTWEWMENKP